MTALKNLDLAAIFILALTLLFAPSLTTAIPTPTLSNLERSENAHGPGTCSPSYSWTVIEPISTLGATCCPNGYKGEQAKILGNLAGVFCCPEEDDEVPCDEDVRKMPQTPVTCPNPGKLKGALCMNYYW